MRRRAQRKPSHSRDPRQAAGSSAAYPRFPDRETWLPYGYRAELTSSFICADLGIEREPDEIHAEYIANWMSNKALAAVLRDKPKLIVSAAAHASKAAEYVHSLQPGAVSARRPIPEPV